MCGGNVHVIVVSAPVRGLSPRVRGKPYKPVIATCAIRSIPACAGETSPACISTSMPPVYPRVCGGNIAYANRHATDKGLSPRVRGKRIAEKLSRGQERSIPACAGETFHRYTVPCMR